MKNTLLIAAALGFISVASCNNAADSNAGAPKADSTQKMESRQERNKKIIMASMEGINAHDANKVMKDAAPDMTDYSDGSMPPVKGDSAKQMLAMFLNAFPDLKSTNETYVADGNTVAVIADWTLTFKNDMMGMKATNKSTKYHDVDVFTLDDNGKVITHRSIYPIADLMMQMGCDMSKMEAGNKDMKKDTKAKM
jgi:predicted ester cyclase